MIRFIALRLCLRAGWKHHERVPFGLFREPEVKEPGSRDGKFYHTQTGHVRYGEQPRMGWKAFSEEAAEVLEQRHALSEKIKTVHEATVAAVDARNRNPDIFTHEARLQDIHREAASLPDELDRLDRRIRQLQRSGALRFGPLRHSRDSADNVNQKSGFWLTLRKAA